MNPARSRPLPVVAPFRLTVFVVIGIFLSSCGLRAARLSPTSANPDDWPAWRGGLGNQGATTTSGTPVIDTLQWRVKTGGIAVNDPVVRGGLLYFGGRDRRLEIYDADDGDRVFRKRFKGPVTGAEPADTTFIFTTDQEERKLYRYSLSPVRVQLSADIPTSAAPPRVLEDGSILITGMRGSLVRFDAEGNVIWNLSFADPVTAPPAVADSLIFVPIGRTLQALRLSDGAHVWTHAASGAVAAAPSVGEHVYFGSTDSLVYAVDKSTGAMVWFFSANGQILTTPAIGDSLVYIAANDRRIYALRAKTGERIWSHDTGAPANKSVTVAGTVVLAGTLLGKLLVLDAATGTPLKSFDLTSPAATSPIVANGRVYIADNNRRLHCFGPATSPRVN